MFSRFYLSLIVLLGFQFILLHPATAQCDLACYHTDPVSEREHSVDIQHMRVEVSFDVSHPLGGKVIGKVTHQFTPLRPKVDTLFFDGPGITIEKATLNGKNQKFTTNPDGVTVFFDTPVEWKKNYTLEFTYHAQPRKGIYFIGWKNRKNNSTPSPGADLFKIRQQIWTQGQGIDNRHWIPMYDNMNDKYTTETVITFDQKYSVLSNGKLMSEKTNKDQTKTWHYRMEKPHAGYLLMLAIGEYDVKKTKTKAGTPVQFWYYPEFKDRVEFTSKYTEEMITYLEEETGFPYPWGSYSQVMVQNFLYGAMENTSATVFGDFFFVNERSYQDRNYINVNCHELTHQWFGDLITARDSRDNWLQESFATFYAKWFFGTISEFGPDYVKWEQLNEFQSAHAAAKTDQLPVRHSGSGTARHYPKGSSVLQMLRSILGDVEFKAAIQYYLEKNAFANVEANNFHNAFKDKLGYNLDWFFDQWVLRGGEPHFQVQYHHIEKATLLTVEQIHPTNQVVGTFTMPVKVALYYTDGTIQRDTLWIDKHFQQFEIPNTQQKKLDFLVFDENYDILKKLTFKRSAKELMSQAIKAQHMADRYEALSALSSFPIVETKTTLEQILSNKKEFEYVRAEAWKQWLAGHSTARQLPAFSGQDPKAVRLALASHLNPQQKEQRDMLISLLKDDSYQVVETALDRLMADLELRKNPDRISWLTHVEKTDGMGKSIRIKWLEYSITLAENQTPLSGNQRRLLIDELVNYAGPDFEFRTRINAMQALQRLNIMTESGINHLFDAIYEPNSRLAGPAQSVLMYFKNQHEYKEMIHNTQKQLSPPVSDYMKNRGL
jgi:aminopeptidase N